MRLVGIDIGAEEVRIAWAERRLGTTRRTRLERRPVRAPDAIAAVLADVARRRPDIVLTALPAALVTHRLLALPFRQPRRIARTAPLELLGQIPVDASGARLEDDDDLVVACAPVETTGAGSLVLAAAVRRADLDAHLARFADAGLHAVRVELAPLPAWSLVAEDDAALVLADGERSALTLRHGGRLAALRALGTSARDPARFGAEVRWSLAAAGGTDRIIVAGADATTALRAAIAEATGARVAPLADDDLAACAIAAGLVTTGDGRGRLALAGPRPEQAGSWRRAAVLAALAIGLGAVDAGLAHRELARRDAALTRAIAADAAAALPGTPIRAPAAQVEAAAAAARRRDTRLGGRASVLELLREVSDRVPPTVRLDLDELSVDGSTVLLHGRTDGFDAVDALRAALAASPALADVTADETRTAVDGRRVEFRLRAARRTGEGASS